MSKKFNINTFIDLLMRAGFVLIILLYLFIINSVLVSIVWVYLNIEVSFAVVHNLTMLFTMLYYFIKDCYE